MPGESAAVHGGDRTRCCIVGGGPAGMMAGFLLARAGVEVLVLEKHADFLRDFRGDTIHPSTLEVMHELGLLEAFLQQPHQQVKSLQLQLGDRAFPVVDFTHLPTHCKYLALMPQWDFLNFLSSRAARFPFFRLRMNTEVTGLLYDGDKVAGVKARGPEGDVEIRADLVVGADGRGSVVRKAAGLEVRDLGAPIDVLWFRLPKGEGDPEQSLGRIARQRFMVLIDRGDYWQCGFVIRKGQFEQMKEAGLDAFRRSVLEAAPFLGSRVETLGDWEQIKLLTVKVDRLKQWARPGLVCIGDSAHAMSPVGGVGINLAIQDAVALANLLQEPLARGTPKLAQLREVQKRREWPTEATQRMQIFMHEHFLRPVFDSPTLVAPPLALRLMARIPILRRIPARLIGVGVRPEHVHGSKAAPK